MRQAKPGDRVLLQGVIDSDHDEFVMVKVDGTAPHAIPQRYDLVAVWRAALESAGPVPMAKAASPAMTEADRADAALRVIVSDPCGCPDRHAGTLDGTCRNRSAETLEHAGAVLAVCIPCARCLLGVEFAVPPGRASGSASRRLRTG